MDGSYDGRTATAARPATASPRTDRARSEERLHSQVRPLPWPDIAEVIRSETGVAPDELFAEIDPQPLDAAAVAQVHRARLRCGGDVVVKVQRPGVLAVVQRDLDIIRRIAGTLELRTRWGREMGLVELAEGFATALREELDFRVEARNTEAVAGTGSAQDVVLPTLHTDLCTRRMLVLERLDGVPLGAAGRSCRRWGRCAASSPTTCSSPCCARSWSTGSATPTRTRATSCCCATAHRRVPARGHRRPARRARHGAVGPDRRHHRAGRGRQVRARPRRRAPGRRRLPRGAAVRGHARHGPPGAGRAGPRTVPARARGPRHPDPRDRRRAGRAVPQQARRTPGAGRPRRHLLGRPGAATAPPAGGSALLVTSRRGITALPGAQRIELGSFGTESAVALLGRRSADPSSIVDLVAVASR